MSRLPGRLPGRLLTASAVSLVCLASGSNGFSPAVAVPRAEGCLASPILLLSQVAQVAGTDSALWADIEQVEQTAAAQGTSVSGQVVQEMLAAVDRDGYRWDCASSQLTAVPGAVHPPNPTTTTTARPAATPNRTTVTPGATDSSPTTVISGATDPSPTTVDTAFSPVAAGPTTKGASNKIPVALLLVLLFGSAGLLVIVFRRRMGR